MEQPAQPVSGVLAEAFGDTLFPLASGIGLASMGAAGIWLLDASGGWLIISIGALALGTVLAGMMLMWYAIVAILGAGAAVVIIPIAVFWELIKAIARLGRKP